MTAHGHTEKASTLKRTIKIVAFGWFSVRVWILALIATHLWTFSNVIRADQKGIIVEIEAFGLAIMVGAFAIGRTWLEETKHHPNKWMMVSLITYILSLLVLWLMANKNGGEVAGILWLPMMGLLGTAFVKGGEGHH
ncbi:MAG: hypothetical protein ACYC5G_01405 [Candidatus Doudnabacteria bacterium]